MFSLHRDLERVWWEVGGHGFLLEEQKQTVMVKISKFRSDFRVILLLPDQRKKVTNITFSEYAFLPIIQHDICGGAETDLPPGLVHKGSHSEVGTV